MSAIKANVLEPTSLLSNSPLRCSDHECSSCCGERVAFTASCRCIFYPFLYVGRRNAGPLRNSTRVSQGPCKLIRAATCQL
jgi:hypothetical protein